MFYFEIRNGSGNDMSHVVSPSFDTKTDALVYALWRYRLDGDAVKALEAGSEIGPSESRIKLMGREGEQGSGFNLGVWKTGHSAARGQLQIACSHCGFVYFGHDAIRQLHLLEGKCPNPLCPSNRVNLPAYPTPSRWGYMTHSKNSY